MLQRQDRSVRTSEWLFLDGFLRSRVLQRLLLVRVMQPRRVIVCALDDQCRELELLVAALFLSRVDSAIRVLAHGPAIRGIGAGRAKGSSPWRWCCFPIMRRLPSCRGV